MSGFSSVSAESGEYGSICEHTSCILENVCHIGVRLIMTEDICRVSAYKENKKNDLYVDVLTYVCTLHTYVCECKQTSDMMRKKADVSLEPWTYGCSMVTYEPIRSRMCVKGNIYLS